MNADFTADLRHLPTSHVHMSTWRPACPLLTSLVARYRTRGVVRAEDRGSGQRQERVRRVGKWARLVRDGLSDAQLDRIWLSGRRRRAPRVGCCVDMWTPIPSSTPGQGRLIYFQYLHSHASLLDRMLHIDRDTVTSLTALTTAKPTCCSLTPTSCSPAASRSPVVAHLLSLTVIAHLPRCRRWPSFK